MASATATATTATIIITTIIVTTPTILATTVIATGIGTKKNFGAASMGGHCFAYQLRQLGDIRRDPPRLIWLGLLVVCREFYEKCLFNSRNASGCSICVLLLTVEQIGLPVFAAKRIPGADLQVRRVFSDKRF
jgi:hypothetical protein